MSVKAATKAQARKKSKKLPVCTAKDLRTKKSKRRRCTVPVKKTPTRASPTGPLAAPPVTTPSRDAFPTPAAPISTAAIPVITPAPVAASEAPTAPTVPEVPVVPTPPVVIPVDPVVNGVQTFQGTFGAEQAHRLLYRAGFGPKRGQAAELAALGVRGAVNRLLNPGTAVLAGAAPTGSYLVGGQFATSDRWGHIPLAFLDRAVRSTDSLSERMTLVLHDWFAVSSADVDFVHVQNHLDLLRRIWRGSFRDTLTEVTKDPAMLWFLSGTANNKWSPNENYARELMELFGLGADRGAYSETDVRELARALTGFRMDWSDAERGHNFRFDPTFHDTGIKTLFAGKAWEKKGNLSWQDAVNAVVDHPLHASFVVLKLWSYFVPTAPSTTTQAALEALYRSSGERLDAVVEAILMHPDLYVGPSMVKSPVTYVAGLMRARELQMKSDWAWLMDFAGQFVGQPPNVSGWNDRAWLNTSTHAARWRLACEVSYQDGATPDSYKGRTDETPAQALASALRFWDNPPLTPDVRAAMERVSKQTWAWGQPNDQYWWTENFLSNRQNALRQLAVGSPDFQVS